MRPAGIIALLMLGLMLSLPAAGQETSSSRKLVDKAEPSYPALARKNGLTGTVKLRVVVALDGRAKTVEVLGGNPVFVENATESVKKWKWATADHESSEVVEVKFSAGYGSAGF